MGWHKTCTIVGGKSLFHSNRLTGKQILTIIIHYLSSIALKKGSALKLDVLCCTLPLFQCLFINVNLSVRCLEKRVCPKALHMLCVVPYHFLSIFIYLSDRCYEKGCVPKLCTCFVLSHIIFHLSSFTCLTVAMKKGLSQKCAHALCCPIPFFIYLHLPVRPLLWKRVCPKSVHMLCVVPYCFSSIFIYLSDRCYEKGFVP